MISDTLAKGGGNIYIYCTYVYYYYLGIDKQGPQEAQNNGQRQEDLEEGEPKANCLLPLAAFVKANYGIAGTRNEQHNDRSGEFVERIKKQICPTGKQAETPTAVEDFQIQQNHPLRGGGMAIGPLLSAEPLRITEHCGQVGYAQGQNMAKNGLWHPNIGKPK
jgi:hypothetical protein